MKKPVSEYTDAEISKRLDFAEMLIQQLVDHNKPVDLPAHLEAERQELMAEQSRRLVGVSGDGI